jgi:hypothetical protein
MWQTTQDLSIALTDSYIGEVHVVPTKLALYIHREVTGRTLPSWVHYYYGTPDERLSKKFSYSFGYSTEEDTQL